MDLTTTYMGFELKNPLVPGASPLTSSVSGARRLEDAGAGALVMRSLFMEQLLREQQQLDAFQQHEHSSAEAMSYMAEPQDFTLGPDEYLDQLRGIKDALQIPVFASLNGTHTGRWTRYAQLMEQAGADGIELNLYHLPLDGSDDGGQVEARYVDLVKQVKEQVGIPVSVKLTWYHASPVHLARQLTQAGADALVVFNRLYMPDIDIEQLEVSPRIHLSSSSDLRVRLLWVAAMYGKVDASLAITGGVHQGRDVVRSLMAGASVTQMASALLKHGADHLGVVLGQLTEWMESHEYESVKQMQGSMSVLRSPDPEAFERANYLKVLHTW